LGPMVVSERAPRAVGEPPGDGTDSVPSSRAHHYGRAVATLAGVAALALGSRAYAPRSGGPAVTVGTELEQAWQRGDRERVHEIVDFRARVEEMLGDVWREAPPEDQDEAVDLAKAMFDTTMERYWTSQYEGRPHQTRISRIDGPHVWVESRAS